MNSTNSEDDRLRRMLRESAPPLPDDGFSVRVLTALPPPVRHFQTVYVRIAVCIIGALVGLWFGSRRGVSFESLIQSADQLSGSMVQAGSTFGEYGFVIAFAVTSLSLLYAFRTELREELPL